jgi:hypothetical protein
MSLLALFGCGLMKIDSAPMRVFVIGAFVLTVGCAKHYEEMQRRAGSYCYDLQMSVARARDNVATDHASVVPYGEIRSDLLNIWFHELAFCEDIRASRAQAGELFGRFQKTVADADGLMIGGVLPPMGSESRAKVQAALGQLASIIEAMNALPLRED